MVTAFVGADGAVFCDNGKGQGTVYTNDGSLVNLVKNDQGKWSTFSILNNVTIGWGPDVDSFTNGGGPYDFCYAYAANQGGILPNPGGEAMIDGKKYTIDDKNVQLGMLLDGGMPVPQNGIIPIGYHLVYYTFTNNSNQVMQDFHFYRLNNNGLWASALEGPAGDGVIIPTDAQGKVIMNPEFANSDFSHSTINWPYDGGKVQGNNYNIPGGYFLMPNQWRGVTPILPDLSFYKDLEDQNNK